MQEEESMAKWIETNMPMTLDKIWPRIEATLTGRSKEQTVPNGEKKLRLYDPSEYIVDFHT